jgi:hypothetical protein
VRPFLLRRRRAYQQSADRMAVKLQAVVEQIRHDYPAAASDVADASIVIGQLAILLNELGGSE